MRLTYVLKDTTCNKDLHEYESRVFIADFEYLTSANSSWLIELIF